MALVAAGTAMPASSAAATPTNSHSGTSSRHVAADPASVTTTRSSKTVDGYHLKIKDGPWPEASHVQGIAVDKKHGYIYYSFTTLLVKTDLAGNVVGTVSGWNKVAISMATLVT
jgi:hypothetical protein